MDFNKIEKLAKKKGLTLKELANKIGITYTTLYRAKQRNSIETRNLEAIARVLGVPVSYFFEEGNNGIQVANNGVVKGNNIEIKQVIAHSHELERENAELKARLEGCEKLLEEKDKQIAEKERIIKLLQQMLENK